LFSGNKIEKFIKGAVKPFINMIPEIICWKLGLLKEKRIELSDIIYETAVVTSKNHKKGESYLPLYSTMDDFYQNLAISPACSGLIIKGEEYNIGFKGKTVHFDLNNKELFNSLKPRDRVRLGYKEVYENIYSYIPSYFDHKFLIDGILKEYKFVSAKKIK